MSGRFQSLTRIPLTMNSDLPDMAKKSRKIAWVTLLVISASAAVGLIFLLLQNKANAVSQQSSITAPQEIVVGEQVLQSLLEVAGTIVSSDSVIVTAPFDGSVQGKQFDFDTQVERGQVLLTLNSSDIQSRMNEAKIIMLKSSLALKDSKNWEKSIDVSRASRSVLTAKAGLADAHRKLQEAETLLQHGIIPRVEYDALLEQVHTKEMQLESANDDLAAEQGKANSSKREIAQIEYENAKSRYEELAQSLENRIIRAPLTGVISQTSAGNSGQPAIDAGARVTKGQALFNIASTNALSVVAKVDETDVSQLTQGQEVNVSFESLNVPPIHAQISQISAQALPNPGNVAKGAQFEIKVALPKLTADELRNIRVGMSCNLAISKYKNSHAKVIPLTYVHQENSVPFALVKDSKGSVSKHLLKLGHTTESGIEVLDGLEIGDRVVVSLNATH